MDKPAAVSETELLRKLGSIADDSAAIHDAMIGRDSGISTLAGRCCDAARSIIKCVSSQTASAEGDGQLPENLVEGIEWWKNGENPTAFTESGLRDFINDLIKHVSVGKGDGWIAVTDRLPEPEQEVWLFGTRNKRPFVGRWRDYSKINHPKITHWRALPAPPVNEETK